MFETERLIIRPMKRDDCDFAFGLWKNEAVTEFLPNQTYTTPSELAGQLEGLLDAAQWADDNYCIADLKEDGSRAGTCCIFRENEQDVWGWGYDIRPDLWNRGLGTELGAGINDHLKNRGITCVRVLVCSVNGPSLRVMDKLRFVLAEERIRFDSVRACDYAESVFMKDLGTK